MPSRHAGEIAALVTAVCWTASALSFETAGRKVGSAAVNLLRMPFAFALLSVYSLFTRGLPLPSDAPARAWVWLSASGLVGFVLGDLLLFRAFVVLGSRLSMLVMTLVPLFTALFGRLVMGETIPALKYVGMGITLVGIGIAVLERQTRPGTVAAAHARGRRTGTGIAALSENKGGSDRDRDVGAAVRPLSGVGLALGGAVGQAMGLVLSKHGMGIYNAFASTQIREIAAVTAYFILFTSLGLWPKVAGALKDRRSLLFISLGSFFGPFLGVAFSLLSVQRAETGVASTIMAIVPVLIIPPSALLLREKITFFELAGAFAAVGGVALLFLL
jgi:drug/metabolite transporter (DMT)-like permease